MRITESMTFEALILSLTSGVPGSVKALISIVKNYREVDPGAEMGFIGYFMTLDLFQIHDQDIYKLYYICEEKPSQFLAVIRALQLGITSESQIKMLLTNFTAVSLDFNELTREVRNKIPDFDKEK